jgi:hypothetical protein
MINYSSLGTIEFNTGSGGSEIYGISWDYQGFGYITIYGVSNIKIARNNLTSIQIKSVNKANTVFADVTGIVISNNIILGYSFIPPVEAYTDAKTISNVIVSNNIMTYNGYHNTGGGAINITGPADLYQNWIVRNNTFTKTQSVILFNAIFENNLFAGTGGTVSFSNVTSSYNVSASATFSGGIGNQNNFDVASAIVGTGIGISDDEAYQIKPGSPLKTAGSAGTEVGAYGGPTPYVVSGIPAIPSIVNMNNTATGSNTVPLSVTISVKSNN